VIVNKTSHLGMDRVIKRKKMKLEMKYLICTCDGSVVNGGF